MTTKIHYVCRSHLSILYVAGLLVTLTIMHKAAAGQKSGSVLGFSRLLWFAGAQALSLWIHLDSNKSAVAVALVV